MHESERKLIQGSSQLRLEASLTAFLLRRVRKRTLFAPEVFDELMGTVPCTSLEVVPLNVDKNGEISVFLTKRGPDDRFWPGLWHCPGTMILNKDETPNGDFLGAWKRLKISEFKTENLPDPVFVRAKLLNGKRGMVTELISFVLIPEDLKGGVYFPVGGLPKNLILHHLEMIKDAAYDLAGSYLCGRTDLKVNTPVFRQNNII